MTAQLGPHETERIEALNTLAILDTEPEREYDDLVRLAAAICGVPMAIVSLVDVNRQWFKARVGIDTCETPRDLAFCAHAILQQEPLIIPDATKDERFRDNPLVTGEPYIRFYAGVPLSLPGELNLGTLCVIDTTPRKLTDAQIDALQILARQAVSQLLLRRETARARSAEARARASEEKFRSVVQHLAEGVLVVDVESRRFVDVNDAVLRVLGYRREELLALAPFEIIARESHEVYERNVQAMWAGLEREGRYDCGRKYLLRKDGGQVPVDIQVSVVPNVASPIHAVIVRDVSADLHHEEQLFQYQLSLEEANARLRAVNVTDALTGVRNRLAFDERLTEEFERSARYGHPLSLILLDIDHFKSVNDTLGHAVGDDALKAAAKVLGETARAADFVARYGGEEFAIVLPETDFAGAMVMAERCRRAIEGNAWKHSSITVSAGVATASLSTSSPDALTRQADEALYEAKRQGRNCVRHHRHLIATPVAGFDEAVPT